MFAAIEGMIQYNHPLQAGMRGAVQGDLQMLRGNDVVETIEELIQTQNNLSVATQTLYDYLTNKKIWIDQAADL